MLTLWSKRSMLFQTIVACSEFKAEITYQLKGRKSLLHNFYEPYCVDANMNLSV